MGETGTELRVLSRLMVVFKGKRGGGQCHDHSGAISKRRYGLFAVSDEESWVSIFRVALVEIVGASEMGKL